jgi:prepilin-type N-terminal cleavage/methylation domain-containing protein/prepilin-type processing-associated H-X9-DG protein
MLHQPHRRPASYPPAVRAFTLVELLVVIGIIAVLVGILLPVLAGARRSAETAQCLSNLRQIGQGFAMYNSEHLGWVIPAFTRQRPSFGGRGEETWATILVVKKYIRGSTDQMDFVGTGGSPPGEDAWDSAGSAGNTVFRCPSGSNVQNTVGNSAQWIPTSKQDDRNAWFWRRQSLLHGGGANAENQGTAPIVDVWYAYNGVLPTGDEMDDGIAQDAFPMRTFGHYRSNGNGKKKGEIVGGPMIKVSKIKKSGEVVMLFDGIQAHDYDTNRISARHGRKKTQTNMLFADGHCETVPSSQLPNGGASSGSAWAGTKSTSDLREAQYLKHSFPKWRLDQ